MKGREDTATKNKGSYIFKGGTCSELTYEIHRLWS
jgi:hypothetical protein